MHASQRGNGPWIAPTVAMEHRQGPQIHRMITHRPSHLVAHRVEERAAMVVHHAFGVTGGARGVIERNGLPFIVWPLPSKVRIAFCEKGFIVKFTDRAAFAILRVIHVNNQWWIFQHAASGLRHLTKLTVSN